MIYLISFFVSLIFTFLLWKIGEKYKIQDEANEDPLKIHTKSVSCLGGLAMFLSLGIMSFLNCGMLSIMAAGLFIFLLGFVDDLRWRDKHQVKKIYKFAYLVIFSAISAKILLMSGIGINLIPIFGITELLTFASIFILMNAVNYQDGMDGLAGGIVIISLIGFTILGNTFLAPILIVIILGFLVFNFPPAKIFMGDSGAYFLGFILAVLSMIYLKPYNFVGAIGVAFILGLPLFDGVYTNIRRLLKGKSIFAGDREHFFDRLLEKGYSIKKVLLICYSIQVIFVIIGLLIYSYANTIV